jgi:DNA-directed RNA polymerase specialized sigma subunit
MNMSQKESAFAPPTNPLDSVLDQKKQLNAARRDKEHAHWQTWKQGGQQPEHLEPLLDSFHPLIAQKTREWKPPMVPESAFQAELQKNLIRAFETYNPQKAALTTHVHNYMQKGMRFGNQYRDISYNPEGNTKHIGAIQKAHNQLSDELGTAPTADQIADHIGMPVRMVAKVQGSIRKHAPGSSWESDPHPHINPREQEVLSMLDLELTHPEHKEVFDFIYGLNGKPRIQSTSAIAQKMGKHQSHVSRIRTVIEEKFLRAMHGDGED